MKLASLFTETMGVNGIEVLEFGSCNSDVKQRFEKAIKELKDPDFETMVTSTKKAVAQRSWYVSKRHDPRNGSPHNRQQQCPGTHQR